MVEQRERGARNVANRCAVDDVEQSRPTASSYCISTRAPGPRHRRRAGNDRRGKGDWYCEINVAMRLDRRLGRARRERTVAPGGCCRCHRAFRSRLPSRPSIGSATARRTAGRASCNPASASPALRQSATGSGRRAGDATSDASDARSVALMNPDSVRRWPPRALGSSRGPDRARLDQRNDDAEREAAEAVLEHRRRGHDA